MKKLMHFAALALLMLAQGAACAMETPSNAVFSPGLKRLAEMEAAGVPLHAEAEIGVDKAMYARDLSVLGDMLAGTVFFYDSADAGEALSIERNGELLGAYRLSESGALDALSEKLAGIAVLERVPLASIAAWLEGLGQGDALVGGFAVETPFALERTFSDDGTRLTKISVSGAIVRAGEEPWKVSGYLRQPAGRAPKDTFELTFVRDEKNSIELLYSALRENEVVRKNREGTASVRTTLKAAGKLDGYGISSRLNVTMKNRWTADGEALHERISITAGLTHQDNTPGRRYRRLNDVAAETKNVIRLTTREGGAEPLELTDEITVSVVMDDNTVLSARADVCVCAGGEVTLPEAQAITPDAAQRLAAAVYAQLDEKTRKTIYKGL